MFWQEPIPTGFAPMIFQDIYAKLGERYAIQLDRSLRKHPFLLALRRWGRRRARRNGCSRRLTRPMCVFKIVADCCCFWYIIIIHTYHWTCDRTGSWQLAFFKNIVVWPSMARTVSHTSMVVRASNWWKFFCTNWRGQGFSLKRL